MCCYSQIAAFLTRAAVRLPLVAFIALIPTTSGCTNLSGGYPLRMAIEYEMSPSTWAPVGRIRWPDPSYRKVQVFQAVDDLSGTYNVTPHVQKKLLGEVAEIRMGELDGRLTILIQAENLLTDDLRDFVVAHESFHLAAQYYGSRIALERLEKIGLEDRGSVNDFWSEVAVLARTSLKGDEPANCKRLIESFSLLSAKDRQYVLGKAYWEWPAEYYAKESVIPSASYDEYLQLREKIPGDNYLYTSGAVAMSAVSKAYGRSKEWQFLISDGESPLDIFMVATGCERLDGAKGFGVIKSTSFLPL